VPEKVDFEGRYRKGDLLRHALAAGFSVSGHLIDDWASKGLLAKPERPGRGRGRGRDATWSGYQLMLFLSLLPQRQKGAHIAAIANIPVWFWLVFGEPYASLAQVRSALKTWAAGDKGVGNGTAHRAARQIVAQFAHPRAGGKRELVALLERGIVTQRIDRDELELGIRNVLDREGTGKPQGPTGAQIRSDHYVMLIEARLDALRRVDEIPDSEFDFARFVYRITRPEYAARQPSFAQDRRLGRLYEPSSGEEMANRACPDLLASLGLVIAKRFESMRTVFTPEAAAQASRNIRALHAIPERLVGS
jgi:hypothetical protein